MFTYHFLIIYEHTLLRYRPKPYSTIVDVMFGRPPMLSSNTHPATVKSINRGLYTPSCTLLPSVYGSLVDVYLSFALTSDSLPYTVAMTFPDDYILVIIYSRKSWKIAVPTVSLTLRTRVKWPPSPPLQRKKYSITVWIFSRPPSINSPYRQR
jgi:hypothetical protein